MLENRTSATESPWSTSSPTGSPQGTGLLVSVKKNSSSSAAHTISNDDVCIMVLFSLISWKSGGNILFDFRCFIIKHYHLIGVFYVFGL